MVRNTRGLGNFQCQETGIETGGLQHISHEADHSHVAEQGGRNIDRHGNHMPAEMQELSGGTCALQHVAREMFHPSGFFALLNEMHWRDEAACRIVPADQCLHPDDCV